MKKWLITIFAIVFLLVTCTYILIPKNLVVSKAVIINIDQYTVYQAIINEKVLIKWWPENQKILNNNSRLLFYNDYTYSITGKGMSSVEAAIKKRNSTINSNLNIIPLKINLIAVEWKCTLNTSYNPFIKIAQYAKAREIKSSMSDILNNLQSFLQSSQKLYGIDITESKVKYTIIATLIKDQIELPNDSFVCQLISSLKGLIGNLNYIIEDAPMISNQKTEDGKYKVMVGFLVNKEITSVNNIVTKKMLPGKLLTGTVTGGPNTIKHGFLQMRKYITDKFIEEAALPYEVAVTDRCIEKDTTKWITKICFPVF